MYARKIHSDMPSFSSTLLDEIYRSIDGNNPQKPQDFKGYREKTATKRPGAYQDEGTSSFRRSCLVDRWMEKESKILQDNDLVFFSSTSSSSDSSGALSSSDTEFFGSTTTTKPKASCFSARLKPVRTGLGNRKEGYSSSDDCYKNINHEKTKVEDDLIKSKSRALKIYANLKKVKQPISPGGRLTSFINSLFSHANGKKSKNLDTSERFQDPKSPKATSTSCSSVSSYSRSCLSKYSPKSREKMRNGAQRTVRFHPVSVIVDEDSRPCGHKRIYDENLEKYGTPPLPTSALTALKPSKVGEAAQSALKGYIRSKRVDEFSVHHEDEEEEEEDCLSDSSSDLFELDHLALFGDNRFCEELPVYETTHFDTNRAIAVIR